MSIHAHPASLARRHAAIEVDIESELKRPLPDVMRLKRLKQLKLRIKDRLAVDHNRDPQHVRR